MYKLTIFLNDAEKEALRALARKEFRDIRAQAALILKEELCRRQSLSSTPDSTSDLQPEQLVHEPSIQINEKKANECR